MTRDLTTLSLQQLVALGFQNKLEMQPPNKCKDFKKYLVEILDELKVIKGLETKEYGQQDLA